jgi:type II secretory pathway pseudopilin PulG
MESHKLKQTGFTFVEILLVTAMLSLIGLAIYSTLFNGITFWVRINQEQPAEDVVLFFEKISRDLKNTFKFTGIDFKGSGAQVSFPSIVKYQEKKVTLEGIGKTEYIFDGIKKTLNIRQSNYSEVYSGKSGYERELLRGIKSLKFRYCYTLDQKQFIWADSWQDKEETSLGVVEVKKIPLAVRIEVEVEDGSFKRKFQRTVFIPAAYVLSFAGS